MATDRGVAKIGDDIIPEPTGSVYWEVGKFITKPQSYNAMTESEMDAIIRTAFAEAPRLDQTVRLKIAGEAEEFEWRIHERRGIWLRVSDPIKERPTRWISLLHVISYRS